jgi:hypothetical protein
MLYLFFGPSCSGKSTVAKLVAKETGADVWTGKDYLRLAKHEPDALKVFADLLTQATVDSGATTPHLIYVMTDPPESIPAIAALTPKCQIRITASLETLTERFAPRTGGTIPPPLVKMLERAKNAMDHCPADLSFDTTEKSAESVTAKILSGLK